MAARTIISLLPAVTALLFLLAGLVPVAAEPHVAIANIIPQGLTKRSLASTSDTECAAQQAACISDASCATCFSSFQTASDDCFASASTCTGAQEGYCCSITAEEFEDCQSSDLVVDVLGAFRDTRASFTPGKGTGVLTLIVFVAHRQT